MRTCSLVRHVNDTHVTSHQKTSKHMNYTIDHNNTFHLPLSSVLSPPPPLPTPCMNSLSPHLSPLAILFPKSKTQTQFSLNLFFNTMHHPFNYCMNSQPKIEPVSKISQTNQQTQDIICITVPSVKRMETSSIILSSWPCPNALTFPGGHL